MDQVAEELVANDVVGNAELQAKGYDNPLTLETYNALGSPIMCASMRSDWAESSTTDYMDTGRMEEKDLSRSATTSAGAEPPCSIPFSVKDSGHVVENSTVGNYWTSHQALGRNLDSNRQHGWQNIYQLVIGCRDKASHGDYVHKDKEKLLSRDGKQPMKMRSDLWSGLKPLLTKQIDHDSKQISPRLRASDKGVESSIILPNGDAPLKTSSMPGFSQPLLKKVLKGKGVPHRNQEALPEFGGADAGPFNGKLDYARKVASDALVRSSSNNNKNRHTLKELPFKTYVHPALIYRHQIRSFTPVLIPRQNKGFLHSVVLLRKGHWSKLWVPYYGSVPKKQRLGEETKSLRQQSQYSSSSGFGTKAVDGTNFHETGAQDSRFVELQSQKHFNYRSSCMATRQLSYSLTLQSEERWYRSPELLNGGPSTFSSNIYNLGVLLFELLSWYESCEEQSAVMLDLRDRILPPKFLSENPREAGFCLWLLHPEPSSRPTAREILQSELLCRSGELSSRNNSSSAPDNGDTEPELLLHFLNLLKQQKQKHEAKLLVDIECLEEDIKEVEKRHLLRAPKIVSETQEICLDSREQDLYLGSVAISSAFSASKKNEARLSRNINQIENAYFSMRSQICHTSSLPSDKDLLKNRDSLSKVQYNREDSNTNQRSDDPLGAFFEGLCKYASYSRFKVCGSLKNGDFMSSTNVVCTLSFDRDEDYIAAAGVSKKIKVFEFGALLNDSMDIHYPAVEMSNKSKISSVCWNNYIKNYLASTDYDGAGSGTGQGFSQYTEHQKRAWSVDFSLVDPMMFASGSDDCSVKLWSINEKSSIGTIGNPANVCCVQFSPSSTNLLAFGSSDYKVYCYDLRHTKIPWCTLAGHGKAVSYVKFLDSQTLVSASTDNTLKLWDLNKASSTGLSSGACSLTFGGHTNIKNFIGLSALDGYIACGSETNEVYCYYRSLPMPITSHKFGCVDPVSGNEIADSIGQFVSSVCWRRKSNMVVAANSSGNMKVLQMV
ncbi:PROTEIN SPA1-RELATED 2 [Salix viminalis]|uniref:PROTEIN SPA1-RELATED 2 n=1 Tax=Salix viminalis TaxID=40686 RepID=A0A9Q0NSS8_SALVM|nr:PROTEIN SPA1-RELATED 2 [Salix viminalis]